MSSYNRPEMKYPHIAWWQRIIQRLAMIEVISTKFLSKYLYRMDSTVLNWSNGKVNLTTLLTGLPVIVITTTGAKSGKPRTIPLAGIPDGERIILVPTNFGQDTYPGWYYNLCTTPGAHIKHNGYPKEYISRFADRDEWEKYWNLAVYYYPGYQSYRERSSSREIPLFILEPAK
ncbi:MAG: nitroreductase family deazaflavin-dependent oxidoreductase [Anaerolineales bacterium]